MFGKKAQPKDEHPMQQEWDEVKQQAQERGLLHRDGTVANPPSGFGAGIPVPHVDLKLIGKEYR